MVWSNVSKEVALLNAAITFKRITSWCSEQIVKYNMIHEDTVENPFGRYTALFSQPTGAVQLFYLGKALEREAWENRQYWIDRKQFEIILYDFNCQFNILKHSHKVMRKWL